MSKTDISLGASIHEMLASKKLETPILHGVGCGREIHHVEEAFNTIMQDGLGLDMKDDSLRDTPKRVAKMFCEEIFYGLDYNNFPKCTTVENKMKYDEMIATKVTVKSCCEHHFVPFIGECHVAYIPGSKVLGLSKFNRVVDFFCRRPQIQERLTEQISATLQTILETDDIAVVIKAKHYCVMLRGVQDTISSTTTSKMSGRFRTVDSLRGEFLALTNP